MAESLHRQRGVLLDDLADQAQLLARRQAVGRDLGDRRLELLVKARDPDHEELVEVGMKDRQELHALEQRPLGVERFLEDPPVEGEPRDLAIEIKRSILEAIVGSRGPTYEMNFTHESDAGGGGYHRLSGGV
jgi:hypothetical protein